MLATAWVIAVLAAATAAQKASSSADSAESRYKTVPVPADSSGEAYKTRTIAPPVILPAFPIEPSGTNAGKMVEFRTEDEMTQEDRALAAKAQPAIHEDALFAGVDFDKGKWTYQQFQCQALPDHLFLLYRGDNGTGDVSLFSAALPRDGRGHVRVIPIERRGFSLYSPAPVNPLTIAAFNRIRASESASKEADWLATALCYAALTGAHPDTSAIQEKSASGSLSLSFPPTLEVGVDGGSTVRFVDSAAAKPTRWSLTFDAKGKLLRVTISPFALYPIKAVPALAEQKTTAQDPK